MRATVNSTALLLDNHSDAYIRIMLKRQHNAIVKRRRFNRIAIKLGLALTVFLICFLLFIRNTSYADSTHPQDHQKGYMSVCVMPGDTLLSIAEEYNTPEYSSYDKYISEVKAINHIHSDDITPGNYLVIPYYECL